MSPATNEDEQEMSEVPYQEILGCLLYVNQGTRPDIAINSVSTFRSNPGKTHWQLLKDYFDI